MVRGAAETRLTLLLPLEDLSKAASGENCFLYFHGRFQLHRGKGSACR